jgi:alpha/beta hydrolase fold
MVSPEALKLNEILRNAPKAVDMDDLLAHQREAGEHAEDMTSEPEGVAYEDALEVGGLWATPPDWDGESAIVYLYGGGYVISSPHSRRKLAGHLANASGARALVPRYHLAPESPFLPRSIMPRPTTGGCSERGAPPSGPCWRVTQARAASRSPRCSNCARTERRCPPAASPSRFRELRGRAAVFVHGRGAQAPRFAVLVGTRPSHCGGPGRPSRFEDYSPEECVEEEF